MKVIAFFLFVCWTLLANFGLAVERIDRKVPPPGIEIPRNLRDATRGRLDELCDKLERIKDDVSAADVDVLLKAVDLALSHGEIYKPDQLGLFEEMLSLAAQRIETLAGSEPDWDYDALTVRGFYSRIDDSPQPYGLVIPDDLPRDTPVPLYVWLHGRGDKTTDIHFIKQRLEKTGQISPPGAMVLHPFGRQCIGFKSAGETDVLEAIQHVKANYNIDPDRVVLMGFSMGGAGTWHLGAHYTDHFAAVSPGAGFAETSKYQKLSAEQIAATPQHERQLWGVYDVPGYVRNLFNIPIVCYSGEEDKQIQAARVMEAAFLQHGKKLDHVIGTGMGHKYNPSSLAEIMTKMDLAAKKGRSHPSRVHLQTRTLRYPKMHWVKIDRLEQHWQDSTVDAEIKDNAVWIRTKNVLQLVVDPPVPVSKVIIDDMAISIGPGQTFLSKQENWRLGPIEPSSPVAKKPGLQGPIDDAFMGRFLVVTPTRRSSNEKLNDWVTFELDHLRARWSSLFRAKLPEKPASEVTETDILSSHLIVFGDPISNPIMRRAVGPLPLKWNDSVLQLAREKFNGDQYVPALIYPNPLNPAKYIVVNSGPTFREAHDRTNSLQNPKLPDWTIFDISTPPNAVAAGKVVRAGFFDENWNP